MEKRRVLLLTGLLACWLLAGCSVGGATGGATAASSEKLVEASATGFASAAETETAAAGVATEGSIDEKRVAKDDAVMQPENPEMPTRVIEGGTRVNMYFGDTVVPGILNDSETAQALIEMLPYTVHMNSYSHDFCGVMPNTLPYDEDEVHYGWLNGDIDYAVDAPYFTILHSDEDISEQYGYQVNIGVLDCELADIRNLSGSYDVRIELARRRKQQCRYWNSFDGQFS